jgi:chromosomal replication initiator protein
VTAPTLTARQLEVVAQYFGVTVDELCGPSRVRELAFARHVAMYLLHRYSDLSFREIGMVLGVRDRSTVMSGVRRIEREIQVYDGVAETVNELGRELREVR